MLRRDSFIFGEPQCISSSFNLHTMFYRCMTGLCLCLCFYWASAQSISSFIHIDQFGYFPNAEKVAVLSDPIEGFNGQDSYTPPVQLEVRDAQTGAVVFTAAPQQVNGGQVDFTSGDRGWWFNFSSLNSVGDYYVYDATNDERSATFSISDNPYLEVLQAAGRMFFYNRCNYAKEAPYAAANWTDGTNFLGPLQDANCRFIYEPDNANLEKDLSGGWFDAGDYNKYVTFTESTIHNMLNAYEENPQAFGDNWNLPESGNGLPDLLDEVKWELDWLLKMTNTDGSVHIKMGSRNYEENTLSPPSANTDQRYYGPTCTSASVAIASVFSHAALVYEQFPNYAAYAQQLNEVAIRSFAYAQTRLENGTLETNCDDESIVAGDADRDENEQLGGLVTAAVYLFESTNEANYDMFFRDHYSQVPPLRDDFWGGDYLVVNDACLRYLTLASGDSATKTTIRNSAEQNVNNNWNGYFGWDENALYRSQIAEWGYYWGSNQAKANYGSLNWAMNKANIGNDLASLQRKATEHIHYFHGVNPLGLVMLSNMYGKGGERCVNEIYHTWFYDGTEYDNALTSAKGPAPGFVTGGPNFNFSITTIAPPAGQPRMKSYLDFNTSWPESSWEISEPAIYYQAAYIRLLANSIPAADVVNTQDAEAQYLQISVHPNPTTDFVRTALPTGNYELHIVNAQGQVLHTSNISTTEAIDLSNLPAGTYWLELHGDRFYRAMVVKN